MIRYLRFLLLALLVLRMATSAYGQCAVFNSSNATECPGTHTIFFTTYYTINANREDKGIKHRWYTQASGGSEVFPTTQESPASGMWTSKLTDTFLQSATYYAAAVCNGVESTTRTAVIITISNPNIGIAPSPLTTPTNFCQGDAVSLTATGVKAGSNVQWRLNDPNASIILSTANTIYPTQSGTYYLKGYNPCGTERTASITLAFNPRLGTVALAPAAGTPAGICQGSSPTTYTVSAPNSTPPFTWSVTGAGNTISNGTVTWAPGFSGTATVSATAQGCNGTTATGTYNVTVHPLPVATLTPAGSAAIPFGADRLLLRATTGSGYTYQWHLDGQPIAGATAATFAAEQGGSYSVRVTGAGTCAVSSAATNVSIDNNYNYIISRTLLSDVKADNTAITEDDLPNLPVDLKQESIAYFDGLGRPMQQVAWQASPTRKDLVQPVLYDAYGRERFNMLPYTGGSDGWYKTDAVTPPAGDAPPSAGKVFDFYNPVPNAGPETIFTPWASTPKPFAETRFEPSPLGRVQEQGAPGLAWQITDRQTAANNKTMKPGQLSNPANLIRSWTYDYALDAVRSNGDAFYAAGQLAVARLTDEHGNLSLEYQDQLGRTVCKRVQDGGTTAAPTFAETHYVYDARGMLRLVIQPEGVNRLAQALVTGTTRYQVGYGSDFARRWCFAYRYDERGRMSEKSVPGAGPVYLVYNRRDELILTQDGGQRPRKEWSFTKYDALGRAVMTGLYTHCDAADRAAMQSFANGGTGCTVTTPRQFAPWESHTEQGNLAYAGYTNQAFPTSGYEPLTYQFYDDYDFDNDASDDYSYDDAQADGLSPRPVPGNATRGLLTGSWAKVLDGTLFLKTVPFYDAQGRVIQTRTENLARENGADLVRAQTTTVACDFAGRVRSQKTLHEGPEPVTVKERFALDHAGRVTAHYHQVGSDPAKEVLLKSVRYNELGQVVEKNLHGEQGAAPAAILNLGTGHSPTGEHLLEAGMSKTATATGEVNLKDGFWSQEGSDFEALISTQAQLQYLQRIHYAYNVRGWLRAINDKDLKNRGNDKDLFGLELSYQESGQYNGNISRQQWRSVLDNQLRGYSYSYDALNRLTKALYQGGDGSLSGTARENYSTTGFDASGNETGMVYDKNGNIRQMAQYGLSFQSNSQDRKFDKTDDLLYGYGAGGNRLVSVADRAQAGTQTAPGVGGDFFENQLVNGQGEEYLYDDYRDEANQLHYGAGNLREDKNKGITAIVYNHLNLPKRIEITRTGSDGSSVKSTIDYLYDATGRKLRKTVSDRFQGPTPQESTSEYLSGFFYRQGGLEFFPSAEGRVLSPRSTGQADYAYEYHYCDHLGNLRVAFRKGSGSTTQVSLEKSSATTEERSWANVKETRDNYTPANSRYARTGSYAAKLYGGSTLSTAKVLGPWKRIPVSKGDKVDMSAYAYYPTANTSSTTTALSVYLTSPGGNTDGVESSNNPSQVAVGLSVYPAPAASSAGGVPKAYLKYLFFKTDGTAAGGGQRLITSLANNSAFEALSLSGTAPEDGYVQVLVANESAAPVWFDDLSVAVQGSLIVQENHYSPWGLNLAGIEKSGSPDHKFQYNGKEKQEELGLNWMDYGARMYDAQLGRWHAVDPHSNSYLNFTPYNYALNNSMNMLDPDGKDAIFSIIRNDNGDIIGINISATVYITGDAANEEVEDEFNKAAQRHFKPRSSNGVNISFNVKYKYRRNMKSSSLKDGENLFVINRAVRGDERAHVISQENTYKDKNGLMTHVVHLSGNTGILYDKDTKVDDGHPTVIHETLHMLGLSDRYWENDFDPLEGFEGDIMADGADIHDIHYRMFREYTERLYGKGMLFGVIQPPSFVSRSRVDIDSRGYLIAPTPEEAKQRGARVGKGSKR